MSIVNKILKEAKTTTELELKKEKSGQKLFYDIYDKETDKPEWIRFKTPYKIGEAIIDLLPDYAYLNRMDIFIKDRGLGTLAMQMILNDLKQQGYKKFKGYIENTNGASQRMMEKLGGRIEKQEKYGAYWVIE
jgi:RimJ/RimL family protein N-acetyltransferase